MSQYLHIFIRNKNDFIELDAYNSGSSIYEAFAEYAPYDKVAPIDKYINDILREVRQDKSDYEKMIQDYNERIETLKTMSGDLNERMDMITSYMGSKDEIKASIEETKFAESIVIFFANLIESYETDVRYGRAPDQPRLYIGLETGSNITPDKVLG